MSAAESVTTQGLPMSVAKYGGDRREDWRTPPEVFAALDAEFGFTLDAAASDENHLCPRYYTQETDGLAQSWAGEVVFCNPPYGAKIKHWTAKAVQEVARGATVVMLVFSYTDVGWFHRDVMSAAEVRFVAGRLKFGHGDGLPAASAPHGSMVVVWRPGHNGPPAMSSCGGRTPIGGPRLPLEVA